MKKRFLSTLLCVAMSLSVFAGCGKTEEPTKEPNVETETTLETEEVEDAVASTNEYLTVDVERAQGIEVGTTYDKEWGTYTVVNSENGLDDVEVQFYGTAFKVKLPQDMGAKFSWNPNEKLVIKNEDGSKLLSLYCSETSMQDKEKDDSYTEEKLRSFWKNSTSEEGYFFHKEWLDENLLSIVFEGNNVYEDTNDNVYGYAIYLIDYEKGICCQFYYTESIDIANKNVARIVADTLELVEQEELDTYKNSVVTLENDGNIDSSYLEKYGLPKDILMFSNDTNVVEENNSLLITTNNISFEKSNEMIKKLVENVDIYEFKNNELVEVTTFSEIPLQESIGYLDLLYKSNDVWNVISFMYYSTGENGTLTCSINPNPSLSF